MSIESVSHETRVFEPTEAFKQKAVVSGMAHYNALCAEAAADYEGFWAKLARELLVWHKPFTKTLTTAKHPSTNGLKTANSMSLPTVWTSI